MQSVTTSLVSFSPASNSIDSQTSPTQAFFLARSCSFFDQGDEVVAPGGDFGEPEMSGEVGPGGAEVGD